MLYEKPSVGARSFARGPQATLGEIWDATLDSWRHVDNTNARSRTLEEAYDKRIDAIRDATGMPLINPMRRGSVSGPMFGLEEEDPHLLFQRELDQLAVRYPDQSDIIGADRPVIDDARRRAAQAEGNLAEIMGRSGGGVAPTAVSFAAGLRASFEDPLNVATMVIGPAAPAAAGVKGLIWAAVKSGVANAAVEASFQPIIASWREEAGLDYSASTAALNVGSAFAFGFGLDAAVRGGIRGVQSARGLVPRLDPEQGGVVGWQTQDQALEEAALRSQAEALRKAAAGDTAALRELAIETGAIDDPVVRGALDELDLAEGMPVTIEGVDTGEHLARIAQAIRHADDPQGVPPPRGAEPVPEARTMNLADDAELPAAKHGNQFSRRFEMEGKPVTLREVDLKRTVADPSVFQFKRGGDAGGVTNRLSGVERWDPIAAGRAVIFERADGTLVVADAHQRRGLALRLTDQETPVQAFVFREADGWSAGDVRALAAKKNLQEGSGTVVDAASIMRERPDIIDRSVPLGSDAMRQARALARLSDDAFGMVVGGVLPPNYAALIGDLVPDRSRHAPLIEELAEADPANIREARFMVGELLALPVHAEEQLTLLGAWRVERTLMRQRAGVLDQALKGLRDDRRIFSLLEREAGRIEAAGNRLADDANAARASEAEQVAAVIEGLAVTRGPVSDWLNDAARAVAQGYPRARAASAFANRVRETLERDGLRGLQAAPEAEPRGIDEPGGPEAQAQIQELETALAAEIDAVRNPPEPKRLLQVGQQTQTPEFKAWFGDSKVVDADGAPLVLYHGTGAQFDTFDLDRSVEGAIFMATDKSIAGDYTFRGRSRGRSRDRSPTVQELYARIENPLIIDAEGKDFADVMLGAAPDEDGSRFSAAAVKASDQVKEFGDYTGGYEIKISSGSGRDMTVLIGRVGQVGKTPSGSSRMRYDIWSEDGRKLRSDETFTSRSVGGSETNGLAFSVLFSLDNGLVDKSLSRLFLRDIIEEAKAKGHDGIWLRNGTDFGREPHDQVVAFVPEQVKSTANAGGFDPLSPNILRDGKPVMHRRGRLAELAEARLEIAKAFDMLPPDVRARVEDRVYLGDEEVAGLWDGMDRIVYVSLASPDPVRTARHEVVHALRQTGLMTEDEFATLYAFAERHGLRKAYRIDEFYRQRYTDEFGADQVEALLREETIAEMFADYRAGRRFGDLDGGVIDRLFEMIDRFLERVRNVLAGRGITDARQIFETMESGEMASRGWGTTTLPGGIDVDGIGLAALKAFHGTPHRFDRFSMSAIGAGEGAQAFGHGLYFAESETVARIYRDALSGRMHPADKGVTRSFDVQQIRGMADKETDRARRENLMLVASRMDGGASFAEVLGNLPEPAMKYTFGDDIYNDPGHLYEVRLHAEPEQMLDWDVPLAQQPSEVKKAIETLLGDKANDPLFRRMFLDQGKAQEAYGALVGVLGSPVKASQALRDAGVAGIRYLDAMNRAAGDGTRNFVIFDENLIEIVAINGEPVASLRAGLDDADRAGDLQSTVEACKL